MQSKYFTVELKPIIPNIAAGQHAAFSANDLVFNWHRFTIPKGPCKLINTMMEIRPKGDSGSTPNKFDLDLIFATNTRDAALATGDGRVKSPTSLGTVNSALSVTNLSNFLVGYVASGEFAVFEAHLDSTALVVHNNPNPSGGGIFFPGLPNSSSLLQPNKSNEDTYYIAGIAGGALDFVSSTLINNGDLDGPIMTVDGTDPRLHFAAGDHLHVTTTANTALSKDMGIIKTMTATTITLDSPFSSAVVNDDIVYNQSPIRIVLTFEK